MRDDRTRLRIDAPLHVDLPFVAAARGAAGSLERTRMRAAAQRDVGMRGVIDREDARRTMPFQPLLETPVERQIAKLARRPADIERLSVDPCRLRQRAVDLAGEERRTQAHPMQAGNHVTRVAFGAAAIFQRLGGQGDVGDRTAGRVGQGSVLYEAPARRKTVRPGFQDSGNCKGWAWGCYMSQPSRHRLKSSANRIPPYSMTDSPSTNLAPARVGH